MRERISTILKIVLPLVIAAVAVLLEPWVSQWAKDREAILPLTLFLVLASLLHPHGRQLLVVTLCYGVTFLAVRDIGRVSQIHLPPAWDYVILDQARPICLVLVATLSLVAAIGETRTPGAVWARRCYFGAASLYFSGLGAINWIWHPNWQAVLLGVIGITALFGCIFAHRIVASEQLEAEEEQVDDEAQQKELEAAHHRVLQTKEWRDADDTPPISLSS